MKVNAVLITTILSLLMVLFSCNNDDNDVAVVTTPDAKDEPKEEIPVNGPPSAFNLIGVTDKAVKVDVYPTFSWEPSEDPEGDAVLYDLYLDTDESLSRLYAANLTDTRFEVTERLSLLKKYHWKVVAKDSKGARTESTVNSFDTRSLRASMVNQHADFRARGSHTSLVFDEKIWVIGGVDVRRHTNDVWATTDGLKWSEATLNYQPPFSGRRNHASAVFDDKMWIIGGNENGRRLKDIWASDNGLTWSEVTSSPPFSERSGHTLESFDNRLWFIAGWEEGGVGTPKNDVWYSNDGHTWTEAISEAPFPERTWHASVVFDNKIWVIGGFQISGESLNDVWYSSDGISWSQATSAAPFPKRDSHSAVVFDNKIWVISGGPEKQYGHDIWFSEDGVDWEQAILENQFPARTDHTAVVFNNKIWMIGGDSSPDRLNDVWTFD